MSTRIAPPFEGEKGLQFYAKDSDGQWFYVNHAGYWCPCPSPTDAEMLEALKNLVEVCDISQPISAEDFTRHIDAALATIAKAEGRS